MFSIYSVNFYRNGKKGINFFALFSYYPFEKDIYVFLRTSEIFMKRRTLGWAFPSEEKIRI